MSTLYQQWQNIAYDETADRSQLEKFWGTYFQIEKEIYEKLLSNPDEVVKGTVKELAEKFGQEVLTMIGFLDGINESLLIEIDLDTVEEDTIFAFIFNFKDYAMNSIYDIGIQKKQDWDTEDLLTKAVTACDGKVVDVNSLVTLKKTVA